MEYRLSLDELPVYAYSSFRYFEKDERHVTRIYKWDVLLIVFEGILRFQEDGVPVEVHAGEYYIQRHGLLQEGLVKSDCPKYFYLHFTNGVYADTEKGLPLRGKVDFNKLFPLFGELETLRLASASLVEKSEIFFRILSILKRGFDYAGHSAAVLRIISAATVDIRRPFSLDDLAQRCGYSKNYMIAVFKRETGVSLR